MCAEVHCLSAFIYADEKVRIFCYGSLLKSADLSNLVCSALVSVFSSMTVNINFSTKGSY